MAFIAQTDVLASNNIQEATALARGREGLKVLSLDVSDQNALSDAVASSDVVVRWVFHTRWNIVLMIAYYLLQCIHRSPNIVSPMVNIW